MEWILFILIFAGGILLGIQHRRIDSLSDEIDFFKTRINEFEKMLKKTVHGTASEANLNSTPSEASMKSKASVLEDLQTLNVTKETYASQSFNTQTAFDHSHHRLEKNILDSAALPPDDEKVQTVIKMDEGVSIEQIIMSKLPVWVGGIALILAGFFLVRYSIELGFFTPPRRIIAGIIFGIFLLVVGELVRQRATKANSVRISQALTGAGIATLFISFYAATSWYNLIPNWLGFITMALVTAVAMLLSLRHGFPIAALSLLTGYLLPALIQSENPQPAVLFTYLFIVFFSLMLVIKRENWWILSIPALIGDYLWVIIWLSSGLNIDHSIWLELFLIANTAVLGLMFRSERKVIVNLRDQSYEISYILNHLGLNGAILLMGFILIKVNFQVETWVFYGILSTGCVYLAAKNQKVFGSIPVISMLLCLSLMVYWDNSSLFVFGLTSVIFALFYSFSGFLLLWRANNPLLWSALTCISPICFYILTHQYFEIAEKATPVKLLWSGIALIISGLFLFAYKIIFYKYPNSSKYRESLKSFFSTTSVGMFSISLWVAVPVDYLAVVFSLQLLIMSWADNRITIKVWRYLVLLVSIAFGCLLIPQIILLLQLAIYSLIEVKLPLQTTVPLVENPVIQLGIPFVMFAIASIKLRIRKDDMLVKSFEIAAVALIVTMGYYLTRHIFHVEENILFSKVGFFERGVITNAIFGLGFICVLIGVNFNRQTVLKCSLVLAGVSIFRIMFFDLLMYNPLWADQLVGNIPIINSLLTTYGSPVVWIGLFIIKLKDHEKTLAQPLTIIQLGLLFVFISLSVRQIFHGEDLRWYGIPNTELYIYSATWLFIGIGYLFWGVKRKDTIYRYASLIIMILTTGKVFVIDAAELDGLLRVFSFLGLGGCLIGLSYFYHKYVFKSENHDQELADSI